MRFAVSNPRPPSPGVSRSHHSRPAPPAEGRAQEGATAKPRPDLPRSNRIEELARLTRRRCPIGMRNNLLSAPPCLVPNPVASCCQQQDERTPRCSSRPVNSVTRCPSRKRPTGIGGRSCLRYAVTRGIAHASRRVTCWPLLLCGASGTMVVSVSADSRPLPKRYSRPATRRLGRYSNEDG